MSAPTDLVSTLCNAWIVRRTDGVALGFTDHDRPLQVDGISCEPETGFDPAAAEASLGLTGDTGEVTGVLSSARISAADIEAGRYDGAAISQWLVDWKDGARATCVRRYHAGDITIEDELVRLELRSLSAVLDRPRGRHFIRACDAVLGDARCRHPLVGSPWRISATISSIEPADAPVVALASVPVAPDWFDHGTLEVGDDKRPILSARALPGAANEWRLTLDGAAAIPLNAGMIVTLVAGCDKAFGTCKAKFSNSLNFRGFPHMPGDDRALRYAAGSDVHDGSPLVS